MWNKGYPFVIWLTILVVSFLDYNPLMGAGGPACAWRPGTRRGGGGGGGWG